MTLTAYQFLAKENQRLQSEADILARTLRSSVRKREELEAESGARLSLLKDISREARLVSAACQFAPEINTEALDSLLAEYEEYESTRGGEQNELGTREHPPRQVSGSRSLETPDAASRTLTWKQESGWTVITSPDKANFLVASPDEVKAFADVPIVWNRLCEWEKDSDS